jgi:hypothetical protein
MDAFNLEPIENHIRTEPPPPGDVLVVRGGPLTVEKLLEHARRQQRAYSYQGLPMASVSVDVTAAPWTLATILEERLWSRSTYAACSIGFVREAGYELLATHAAPHFDILLPAATEVEAQRLLAVFGEGHHNPCRRRKR